MTKALGTVIPFVTSVLGLATVLLPLSFCRPQTFTLAPQPKHATVTYIGPMDPLLGIPSPEMNLRLTARIGKARFSYLRAFLVTLVNDGSSAILPAETFEPLGVQVDPPWRIVEVTNDLPANGQILAPAWRRVSETEFAIPRLLINPRDTILAFVVLTRSNLLVSDKTVNPPRVRWEGRVTNLSRFDPPAVAPDDRTKEFTNRSWGLKSDLSGWGVPFVLVATVTTVAAYLLLLDMTKLLQPWRGASYLLVLFGCLISLCSSEALATYLFGSVYTVGDYISPWLNAPPILANGIALVSLSVIAFKKRKSHTEQPASVIEHDAA